MAAEHLDGGPRWTMPEVRLVLEQFGLPGSTVESLQPLSGAGHGNSARVRGAVGDWVVKRHPTAGAGRLDLAHRLELRLAEHAYPVAPIRTSPAGDTLVAIGPSSYTLHPWVTGGHITIAQRETVAASHPDLLPELGTALGELHALGADLPVPPDGPRARSVRAALTAPIATARTLRRPTRRGLSAWQTLRLRSRKNAFDRWILRRLPEVAEAARQLATGDDADWGEPGLLTTLHNDLNWENLVLDEGMHLLALLDFDNVVRGPRTLEVGAAAVVLAGVERQSVESFVGAYEDRSGVPLDRAALRTAMMLKCTQSILYSVSTYLHGRACDPDRLAVWCAHLDDSLRHLRADAFR